MKCFVIVAVLVGVALARPDVSHLSGGYNYKAPSNDGYNYQPPATSYGVPIQSVGSQQVISGNYLPPGQALPLPDSHVDFTSGNRYHSGWVQNQKRVFFFANQDDQEEQQRLRINIVPSHQKHENTIFVKAPHYPAPIPEIHAPPSTVEDKTKVVVLVKKPEQPGPINIPAPPVTKIDNPEVSIVKYHDQHEAERAVASGSADHLVGSNVQQVGEQGFVKTLEEGQSSHGSQHGSGVVGGLYEAALGSGGSSHSSSSFVSGGSSQASGGSTGGVKITVEATNVGGSLSSTGSSHSSQILEDDSLFSKYGPP